MQLAGWWLVTGRLLGPGWLHTCLSGCNSSCQRLGSRCVGDLVQDSLTHTAAYHHLVIPPLLELGVRGAGQKPQNDEDDMGISYEDLGIFGRMRKVQRYGPVSMFTAAVRLWHGRYSPQQIANKVKFFYRCASPHVQLHTTCAT